LSIFSFQISLDQDLDLDSDQESDIGHDPGHDRDQDPEYDQDIDLGKPAFSLVIILILNLPRPGSGLRL
jgi:hypothetical protein